MAVYTRSTTASLDAFLAALRPRPAARACKGIAEGVENSNFRLVTERGRYILTLYEKRVDPADLPFFLDLMNHLAAQGRALPDADHGAGRRRAAAPVRPAGGDRQLSRGHRAEAGRAGALRGARRGAGAASSGRRGFRQGRGRTRSRSRAGDRCSRRCRGGADRLLAGLAAEIDGRARGARARLAGGSAAWRDPCRPVPGQRVLRTATG